MIDVIAVVLVAEIVQHFKPQLIHMHNYTPGSGLSIKKDNWNVLNRYQAPSVHRSLCRVLDL